MQMLRRFAMLSLFVYVSVANPLLALAATPGSSDSSLSGEPSSPPAVPPKPSAEDHYHFGVGLTASTLGIGGEVALPVVHRANIRFGFNAFNYNHTFTKDGVSYKGSLDLRSAEAVFDFFPPFTGGLHLSPGVLLYNGNKVSANASVPGGQSFTLNGASYASDPANPITGTGKMTFYKAAPMFLLGFGNLVPRSRRHFSLSFDLGAAYQGPPKATLVLAGNACDASGLNCRDVTTDPTIQSNIQAEQGKINHSAAPFRFYPVVSFEVGYKF